MLLTTSHDKTLKVFMVSSAKKKAVVTSFDCSQIEYSSIAVLNSNHVITLDTLK